MVFRDENFLLQTVKRDMFEPDCVRHLVAFPYMDWKSPCENQEAVEFLSPAAHGFQAEARETDGNRDELLVGAFDP